MYSLIKSPLYNLRSRKKLIELCGSRVTYKLLNDIFFNSDSYYREFQQQTAPNKIRDIACSTRELEIIQTKFQKLLTRIELPSYLYSKKGTSHIKNALLHRSNDYVLTIDLKDFYPHCTTKRLASSLKFHFNQEGDISFLIASLLTFKGATPQGCTTSTLAAFWSNKSMFDEIDHYCTSRGMKFSLFVDDLTISSDLPVSKECIDGVITIIRKNSMPIKYSKIKLFKKNQPKHITGICITDHATNIDNKKLKKLFREYKIGDTAKEKIIGLYKYAIYVNPNNFNKTYASLLK